MSLSFHSIDGVVARDDVMLGALGGGGQGVIVASTHHISRISLPQVDSEVNRDGRDDIIQTHAVNWPGSGISIYRQTASGRLRSRTVATYEIPSAARSS